MLRAGDQVPAGTVLVTSAIHYTLVPYDKVRVHLSKGKKGE